MCHKAYPLFFGQGLRGLTQFLVHVNICFIREIRVIRA